MYRLLCGDKSVELTKVVIDRPERQLVLDDKESLTYLSEVLRRPNGDAMPGASYTVHFYFGRLTSFTTMMDVQPNRFSLSMPKEALEEAWPTHGFALPAPLPKAMQRSPF